MVMILILFVALAVVLGVGGYAVTRATDDSGDGPFGRATTTVASTLSGRLGPVGGWVAAVVGGALLVVVICWPVGKLLGSLTFVDHPAYHFVLHHQPGSWTKLMGHLTNLGSTANSRAIAVGAGVTLALVQRDRRWLPLLMMAAAVLMEHYLRNFLASSVHRGHPPTSGGTFPSGGVSRTVAIYGTIAFLALYSRAEKPSRRLVALVGTVIAALAMTEAYTRWELNKHWLTDTFGGMVYGLVILSVFVVMAKTIDGTLRRLAAHGGGDGAADPPPRTAAHRRGSVPA